MKHKSIFILTKSLLLNLGNKKTRSKRSQRIYKKNEAQAATKPPPPCKVTQHYHRTLVQTPGQVLRLFLPDEIEMAEPQPRATSQPQQETQTRNEIKTLDDMKEEVEMNALTPDADPKQDEAVDSDPELRNLEGKFS